MRKFIGEWDVVSEGSAGEGQPPIKGKAVMKSSMLGKLWLVNSSDHEISGMKMQSIQMIGYDTKKKKYVGIWADSMINYMWHYEGTVDKAGKKMTLGAEGPRHMKLRTGISIRNTEDRSRRMLVGYRRTSNKNGGLSPTWRWQKG